MQGEEGSGVSECREVELCCALGPEKSSTEKRTTFEKNLGVGDPFTG